MYQLMSMHTSFSCAVQFSARTYNSLIFAYDVAIIVEGTDS